MIGEEGGGRLVLERLGADAWPPLEQVEVDGWRLRASAGVTKRANSALPLSDALPLEEVVAFYRERGLPPRVQVSSRDVDEVLAARGWERDAAVDVLTGPVPAAPSAAVVAEQPDDAWVDCWWSVDGRGGDAEREVAVAMLARVPAPAGYAAVVDAGRVVAVGRAVVQGEHVGVFSMGVLDGHRRRGLGRSVLHALGAWAADHGARTAYLQVLSDNAPARALYESSGLRAAHGYHYRTLP